MKERNVKKLGFFSALTICIGSIVGIGIFFKNGSIANAVNGDGWAWLATWVISGIIALLVAIHFGKISMVSQEASGLSEWSQIIAMKKENWFRHAVTINYSFFYNSILLIVLSFFTAEIFGRFLFSVNPEIDIPIYAYVIMSIFLVLFFVFLNKVSVKASGMVSSITTILKFVPFLIALIVGTSLPNVNNAGGENAFIPNPDNDALSSFQGIMKSLPAALFAFDAFIGVGSMSKKINGGEKVVSKVIVFGMLFVVISYTLIAISSILHYEIGNQTDTSIEQIITNVFGENISQEIKIVVMMFLLISATGTLNAVTGVTVSEFENITASKRIFYSKQLNERFGSEKTSIIYLFGSLLFWSLVAYIPTLLMNSDAFVDGMSNMIVLFFFIIYAILIFLYWKNIYRKQDKSKTNKFYTSLVFISVFSVLFSMLLSVFFMLFSAIQNPDAQSSWGLFFSESNWIINNVWVVLLLLLFGMIFVAMPLINYLLFKIKDKNVNIFQDVDLEVENWNLDKQNIDYQDSSINI